MTSEQADLPDGIDAAVDAARRARSSAYAPYSKFKMGAGISGANGEEVIGTLIENVSLGLAMCAERVALFSAVTHNVTPHVLAVCSERTEGELTFPCGACLQVALELAGPDLLVVAVDTEGVQEHRRLRELLPNAPHRFTPATQPGS